CHLLGELQRNLERLAARPREAFAADLDRPALISLRSALAQKTGGVALSRPTHSAGSPSRRSRAASSLRATSPLIAFRASGRLMVMTATCPRASNSTTPSWRAVGGSTCVRVSEALIAVAS